jgi:hypothetical protein
MLGDASSSALRSPSPMGRERSPGRERDEGCRKPSGGSKEPAAELPLPAASILQIRQPVNGSGTQGPGGFRPPERLICKGGGCAGRRAAI